MTIDGRSDYSIKRLLINLLILFELNNLSGTDATSCILRNGQVGECTQVRDCRSAIFQIQRGENPEYCVHEDESVCCTDYIRESSQDDQESRTYSTSKPNPQSYESSYNIEEVTRYSSLNYERRKHSVRRTEVSDTVSSKERHIYEGIEEFEKFEKKPNNLYVEKDAGKESPEGEDLPNRRNPHGYNEKGYFEPPGLAKKKHWTGENHEYIYDQVIKKGPQGPSRVPGIHPAWAVERTTRRPEWFNQGERVTVYPYNWGQNQNGHNNQWSTTKNKWTQETTTVRNQGNRPVHHNNQFGQNFNSNFWPQRTSTESVHYVKPTFPQDGSRPGGSRPGNSRPNPPKRLTMSEKKCLEYSREVTENITGLPLTTNPNPVIIPVRKCVQAQQLIVGGENTTLGEFPHMAAVGFRGRNNQGVVWNCGGTLISEQFVLTAAHCTSTSSGRPVKVRLGEYNLLKNDDGAHPVDYGISEIITHPGYKPPSKYHDIALLKLSRRVKFYKHIRPACLYLEDTFSLTKAVATGWGRMFYDGNVSEVLQKVVLSIVDNHTCNRLYKLNVKTEVLSRGIVDSQLCAGELSGGKDTCQGDSGGPLSITNIKCIHHIIGITSFGKSCALPNSTGVYTKVSAYIPWIESIVWPEA